MSLGEYPDSPYLAASLLKLFLRSLPIPIFPTTHFHLIRSCPLPSDSPILPSSSSATRPAVDYIRTHVLPSLSRPTLLLLQRIVALLHEVSLHKDVNLMDSNNLVICLGPGFVGGLGIAKAELEMCRVPRTIARSATERRKETNTVGGMLKVMIEWCALSLSSLRQLTFSSQLPRDLRRRRPSLSRAFLSRASRRSRLSPPLLPHLPHPPAQRLSPHLPVPSLLPLLPTLLRPSPTLLLPHLLLRLGPLSLLAILEDSALEPRGTVGELTRGREGVERDAGEGKREEQGE